MKIEDGKGTGKSAKVDNEFRLRTQAVSIAEALHAAEDGRAYNVNSGLISITGDATILYLKNNGDLDIVVAGIAVGLFTGITHVTSPYMTVTRNPTGGDLISDATAVTSNVNRNFGATITLTAEAYKGKVGGTLTGGSEFGVLQVTSGGRSFFSLDIVIPKGSSIGLDLTASVSSGSANAYAAFICYEKTNTED